MGSQWNFPQQARHAATCCTSQPFTTMTLIPSQPGRIFIVRLTCRWICTSVRISTTTNAALMCTKTVLSVKLPTCGRLLTFSQGLGARPSILGCARCFSGLRRLGMPNEMLLLDTHSWIFPMLRICTFGSSRFIHACPASMIPLPS